MGKGKSIATPFSSLNVLKDDDAKLKLVRELRSKQVSDTEKENIRNKIIVGHIRLIISIAAKYAKMAPTKDEELSDEACVALVKAVRALEGVENENVTGFIVSYVWRRLSDFLRKERRFEEENVKYTIYSKNRHVGMSMTDVWDLVDKITRNDTEKTIVKMRMEGYIDREIGEQLNCSKVWVGDKRQAIGKRYKQYINNQD